MEIFFRQPKNKIPADILNSIDFKYKHLQKVKNKNMVKFGVASTIVGLVAIGGVVVHQLLEK